jgi:hypothetical protein
MPGLYDGSRKLTRWIRLMNDFFLSFGILLLLIIELFIAWLVLLAVRKVRRTAEKLETLLDVVEGLRRNEDQRLLRGIISPRSRAHIEMGGVAHDDLGSQPSLLSAKY